MSSLGFISTGVIGAAEAALFRPKGSKRKIGTLTAQVTIEERHTDEMETTRHPVDQGASITDHAFKRPAVLFIRASWSASPAQASLLSSVVSGALFRAAPELVAAGAAAGLLPNTSQATDLARVYSDLLNMQAQAQLVDIVTGKRAYTNMLLTSVMVDTTVKSENSLDVVITAEQVIIVSAQVVSVSSAAADQQFQHSTAPLLNTGAKALIPGSNFNAQAGP